MDKFIMSERTELVAILESDAQARNPRGDYLIYEPF